jgi:protein TonB
MNASYEESSTCRWIISGAAAVCGIVLFMVLSLGTMLNKELPDIVPHLEVDFVTVEEPRLRKGPPPPPPQRAQPKRPVTEEPLPQVANDPSVPDQPPLEASPVASASNIPAAAQPPATASHEPQRIGSAQELDNVNFEPVFNPRPDYPPVAQSAGITGYVDVDLVIGDNGKVRSFSVVSVKGHPAFGVETAKVLPKWRFPPPRIKGKKTSVKYLYRIKFTFNALE